MTYRLLALLLGLCLALPILAQPTEAQVKKSAEIQKKLRQLDILNQVLPVLMTKEQLDDVLKALAKARQKAMDVEKAEAEVMAEQEKKIDAALAAAKNEAKVPSDELVADLTKMFDRFDAFRKIVVEENTQIVTEALEKTLNKGQIKAAANALNLQWMNPGLETESLTDAQKLRLWARAVLLDPLAYDVLRELSRAKPEDKG